jgi:hypothetical protein
MVSTITFQFGSRACSWTTKQSFFLNTEIRNKEQKSDFCAGFDAGWQVLRNWPGRTNAAGWVRHSLAGESLALRYEPRSAFSVVSSKRSGRARIEAGEK